MRRRTLLCAAMAVPVLAGCTEKHQDPPAGAKSSPKPTISPRDTVDTVQVMCGHVPVAITVHPLVRSNGHLLMSLTFTAAHGKLHDGPAAAYRSQASSNGVQHRLWDGIRVLNLADDKAGLVAMDAKHRSLFGKPKRPLATPTVAPTAVLPPSPTESPSAADGQSGSPAPSVGAGKLHSETVQFFFGDPGGKRLAVLLPKAGLVSGIPVLDQSSPTASPAAGPAARLDAGAIKSAPVSALTAYSVDLSNHTRTRTDDRSGTVSLSSDMLFAPHSAKLSDKAGPVIEQAAYEIGSHAPGKVSIVGYTDNTGDDADNMKLSKQRAKAVAAALSKVIDTGDYPLEQSGQGKHQPVGDNHTTEGKALNRRVDLSIDTPVKKYNTQAASLPKFDGLSATGDEGISLGDRAAPVRLRAPEARVVKDHLVVRLEFTRTDDRDEPSMGSGDLPGDDSFTTPKDLSLVKTDGGVAVLSGSTAYLPMLHRASDDHSMLRPLADLNIDTRLRDGQTRVDELVFPQDIATGKTVTIQLLQDKWRLTNIPIRS